MNPLDSIPLWLLALLMIGVLSIIIELGFQAGKRIASEKGLSKHPVEASVSTAMLGLLAFMLAFTFGAAVSRSKESRQLAVADLNNTVTLYRLADLMKSPENQEEFRALTEEYKEIRSAAIQRKDLGQLAKAMNRSREIQDRLWDLTLNDGDSPHPELVKNLLKFVETDSARRATGLHQRLPMTIWYTLGGLTALTTGLLGMNSGLHGRRSRLVATLFIVAYSIVLLLIVDLDRPFRTLFESADAKVEKAIETMPES